MKHHPINSDRVEAWLDKKLVTGCITMHSGLKANQRDAKTWQAKEHARRAAALLFRLPLHPMGDTLLPCRGRDALHQVTEEKLWR